MVYVRSIGKGTYTVYTSEDKTDEDVISYSYDLIFNAYYSN